MKYICTVYERQPIPTINIVHYNEMNISSEFNSYVKY